MTSLEEAAARIKSRQDLASFIGKLAEDRHRNPTAWASEDLRSYLDALAAWTDDMDGYFANQGKAIPSEPSWRLIGAMLLAARVYE
jgi:hypothetical protein